jgi:hypothetical protein
MGILHKTDYLQISDVDETIILKCYLEKLAVNIRTERTLPKTVPDNRLCVIAD